MAGYTTSLTRATGDAGQIEIVEDIFYDGVRVGGVRVVIAGIWARDAKKLWSPRVASNVRTTELLRQQVEISYDGRVVGGLTIEAVPDPTLPSGHGMTIDTTWDSSAAPPTAAIDAQILT